MSATPDGPLREALSASQRLGMLGRRPIPEVIAHAEAFVDAIALVSGVVVDLGSGGGVPGLVIAGRRLDLGVVLVDRRVTRTDHLSRLVGRLGWTDRVAVVTADVERDPEHVHRGALDLGVDAPGSASEGALVAPWADAVVARSFGAPATTLRAAARFLRPGGRLVVSEPPSGGADRWPPTLVDELGLRRRPHADSRVVVFEARPDMLGADVSRESSPPDGSPHRPA